MKNLFTISQVSKCCGLSRSTILRLENKGLLTPAFIDEKSGYRYYDNHNISKILQIKCFLTMNMRYEDILLYYTSHGTSSELLKSLETKLFTIKRTYEEMKIRIDKKEERRFEIVMLPEYVCYSREYTGTTTDEKYQHMYHLFHEVVEKGYRPLPSGPLFTVNKRTDFLEGDMTDGAYQFICCIPLDPASAPKEATVYPSCKAFSCLYYGNYDELSSVYHELGRKMRALGLKATGYPRVIGIVAPYTGREIPADNYVSQLVVPIEEPPGNQA